MPQSLPQTQMPNNLMHVHSPLWCQHPAPGAATDNMAWKGLPDQPMLTNTDLVYSDDASQSTLDKPMDFESSSFWIPTSTSNMAPSPGIGALLSPISPSNDVKHISSPIPDYSPVTPDRGPASYTMACGVSKVYSSPGFVPPTPQSVVRQQSGHTATPSTFSNPVTSVREPVVDNTIKQNDDMTMYGSEHSYEKSHSSSPGMVQWFPPGYLAGNAAPAQSFQHHQSSTARFDLRPNSFLTSFDRGSRQRQAQWSNTTVVPAQTHFQNRFMTPLSDGDKAQRSKDDETLLRMKKNGYTYRDIRKALGRKVAESTLRGRYRSLTKPRKDRLRAPKWTEIDVRDSIFDSVSFADQDPDRTAQTLRGGRVRQARRDAAFPQHQAKAGQGSMDEDCRTHRVERGKLQVWCGDGQEEVV